MLCPAFLQAILRTDSESDRFPLIGQTVIVMEIKTCLLSPVNRTNNRVFTQVIKLPLWDQILYPTTSVVNTQLQLLVVEFT